MTTTLQKRLRMPEKGMKTIPLSFLLGVVGAFFILLPFLVVDKGFFQYCGDYNAQQIPFYYYVQQFVKSFSGTWSWATDLGTSAINSYSFYNIGSPFFWLTLLFPASWLPYMMVPLFMLKFGCIAAAAALYLQRYGKTRNMVVISSVLYAFCGFNVYNIFFNHMLDPVVIFPLMLWAMDNFVYEKKRGWFALFVGLSLLNSYFFFIGNVVFLLIYFFVKVAANSYRLDAKEFGLLLFEAVLGVAIGMALALPSFFNLMGNPRTDNFASGLNMIMYWNPQQYFNIFSSMFLPPDPPYMPNLFPEGAIKWTSMSAFLPILSMSGVIAFFKARKKSWLKNILLISLLFAVVPFLNSSFYAFNASYYARWYYMPILMMVLATLQSLEDTSIDLVYGAKMALGITAAYAVFGLIPKKEAGEWSLGVAEYASKFWLTFITAILGVGIGYLIIKGHRHKVKFAPMLLAAIMGFSVFYSVIHIALGKFPQWERDANYQQQTYRAATEIDLPEDSFYRIDTFGAYDNIGLWLNKSCLQNFNSVVTPSIMEFYPMVGVKRDVSSKPSAANYALRGLLNVQYTLVPLNKLDVPISEIDASRDELGVEMEQYAMPYTSIPAQYAPQNLQLGWAPDADGKSYIGLSGNGARGWNYYGSQAGYAIFENENFVPLGFTYDEYILMDNLWLASESDRAPLLMKGIGLTEEQAGRFGYLFGSEIGTGVNTGEAYGQSPYFIYDPVGYEEYVQLCNRRRATSSYAVTADASGFTSKINLEKGNLVFFGVPYDEGFTATVNGVPAEVLSVSGGMMAVYAPAGDCTIVFTYKTPGFGVGLVISFVALAVLVAYLVLCRWAGKRAMGKTPQPAAASLAQTTAAPTGNAPNPKNPPAGQPPGALGKSAPPGPQNGKPPAKNNPNEGDA